MDEKQKPLQDYSTEAYTPNPGADNTVTEAVRSGVAANETNGVMAQGSVAPASSANGMPADENAPQTPAEAQEGPSTPQHDTISTLSQKSPEMAKNSLSGQNGESLPLDTPEPVNPSLDNAKVANLPSDTAKMANQSSDTVKPANPQVKKHKKRAKTITVIAILATALILGIAVAVAWWIIDSSKGSNQLEPEGESTIPVVDENLDEASELALDDELVQELYGQFDVTHGLLYLDEDILAGNIGDDTMLRVSLFNTKTTTCKQPMTNELIYRRYSHHGESFIESWGGIERFKEEFTSNECYSGADVLTTMNRIFGTTMTLSDGMAVGSFTAGGQPVYEYDEEYDEFWYVFVPGGGSGQSILHDMYMAKTDGERIYLYDLVGKLETCELAGKSDSLVYVAGGLGAELHKDGYSEMWGRESSNMCNEEYLADYAYDEHNEDRVIVHSEDFVKYPEKFDKFKWTFTKTPEGNYVFSGLEKIEN